MPAPAPPQPPAAPRRPHPIVQHGQERVDDWFWMRDRDDPAVIAYLEEENAYTEAVLAPTLDLQEELFQGIRSKVAETDAGAAVHHGGWWYFSRTEEGLQYPIACRLRDRDRELGTGDVTRITRAGRPDAEEVILDENKLAEGEYLALGVFDVSPDHSLLAYAVDHDGSELFTLRFRDLTTGDDLADTVTGVYYGSAWAADNRTFFYVRPDEAIRPYQVWRHVLGGQDRDVLVFEEGDERFFVGISLSRDESRVVIHSASSVTSEARWIDAHLPAGDPKVILERSPGVEYDVEYDAGSWLVRTNRPAADGSPRGNFALYRLPESGAGPADLQELIAHRENVTLEGVDAFADYLAVWERHQSDGLGQIRIVDKAGGEGHLVEQPEPVFTVSGEGNPDWQSPTYRFGYTSLVTPATSVEYEVSTRDWRPVWTQLVPSGHDPGRYRTERLWAPAADGRRVPVSVVALADRPLDGTAPCVLYGYGAYEITIDPAFSVVRQNLIERGVTFAIAHVRGGGELGRRWYEEGRLEHKANSFTDFVAAADHLVATGWADPARLSARGGSAGGLLMGAVVNIKPERWRVVVAEVPFVDVVSTMSDPSLPLTVTEWDEWGDPLHDVEAFRRMLGYSPYDNVVAADYPAMYVTGGLNDPRVGYWEPAKWVAKLRSVGAGGGDRPLLLRTELGAGHRGVSGRYDAWRDEARVQAFILWQLGMTGLRA